MMFDPIDYDSMMRDNQSLGCDEAEDAMWFYLDNRATTSRYLHRLGAAWDNDEFRRRRIRGNGYAQS